MKLQIHDSTEYYINYQGFKLSNLSYDNADDYTTEQIVEYFINSEYFPLACTDETVLRKQAIGCAFNINEVRPENFRKFNNIEIEKYLSDFINEPDWGEDRLDFAKILDRYFEIHKNLDEGIFYVINMDWFEQDDKLLLDTNHWVYIYYFLIIYIDVKTKTLKFSEWEYE